MLSSPNTHINNAFSGVVQAGVVKPVEKTLAGGIDFLASAVTGKERTAFAGEGAAYAKGFWSKAGEASHRFGEVMRGTAEETNLDTRSIPLAPGGGVAGWAEKKLSYPLRLLEGMDQFFTTMAKGGEEAALDVKMKNGVKVAAPEVLAAEKAAYTVFRDAEGKGQNAVLSAIDTVTNSLNSLRNSDNAFVRIPAKFTVPFLRTPMNIFKQGLEYSPAGLATVPGAANWQEQVAKAAIGSTVFAGAATLLGSGRLTWAEPTSEKQRNAFRQAGMQPYAVKIGDKWVSYSKLGPLAFPIAMVAAIDDAEKNGKLDESTTEQILSGIAKYGGFLADQSYAKNIGDLISAAKGGESGVSRLVGNYPQQLVPYRAAMGWLTRLGDDTQRKVDPQGSFIEKQVQQMMMQIPGLSGNVPARMGPDGQPVKNSNNLLNSVLPLKVTSENPDGAEAYASMAEESRTRSLIKQENAKAKQEALNDRSRQLEEQKGKASAAERSTYLPLLPKSGSSTGIAVQKGFNPAPGQEKPEGWQDEWAEPEYSSASEVDAAVKKGELTASAASLEKRKLAVLSGEEPDDKPVRQPDAPIEGVTKRGSLYTYEVDGEVKTTSSLKEANKAAAKALVLSGERDRVDLGNGRVMVPADNENGWRVVDTVEVKRKAAEKASDQRIKSAKDSDDYQEWESLQKERMASLFEKAEELDPELDADTIADLEADRRKIADEIAKYRSYGGAFKKPPKPKKIKRISI